MNPNNQSNAGFAERSNKFKVTERALFARLKRNYRRDGMLLRTCRENSRGYYDLGRYYAVDFRNCIAEKEINLELMARERGVLRRLEEVTCV